MASHKAKIEILVRVLLAGVILIVWSCAEKAQNRLERTVSGTTNSDQADASASSGIHPMPICGTNLGLSGPNDQQGRPSDCGDGFDSTYLTMACAVIRDANSVTGRAIGCGVYDELGKKFKGTIDSAKFRVRYPDLTDAVVKATAAGPDSIYSYILGEVAGKDPKDSQQVVLAGSYGTQRVALVAIPSLGAFLVKTEGPMKLYVRADGVDRGVCDDPARPCATLEKALSVIPFKISHVVQVYIAGPSLPMAFTAFPNFAIEGDTNSGSGEVKGRLNVEGRSSDFGEKSNVTLN